MNIYDCKTSYEDYLKKYKIVESKFKGLAQELLDIEQREQEPDYWQNHALVSTLSKKKKAIEKKLASLKKCETLLGDLNAYLELIEEGGLDIEDAEINSLIKSVDTGLQELWVEMLLSKEYDDLSAIVSLHSGAGGEEAQDWTEMLSRMYLRYAEVQGYKVSLLDYQAGDGAGIKSVTYLFDGSFAYGYLKTEAGVHRLVRLSPFDANNKRHTSFASVEISPLIEDSCTIEINPNDLKIDTYCSSGAGGQHVNKTESAVRITHLPTGVVVQCHNERSQLQNKEMEMKMLQSKLVELDLREKEKQKQEKFGEIKKIEWGSQIRSYVLHPYNMVKDHRTGMETSNTTAVLDGELQNFINEMLRKSE